MKKYFLILISCAMLLSFAGCDEQQSDSDLSDSQNSSAQNAADADTDTDDDTDSSSLKSLLTTDSDSSYSTETKDFSSLISKNDNLNNIRDEIESKKEQYLYESEIMDIHTKGDYTIYVPKGWVVTDSSGFDLYIPPDYPQNTSNINASAADATEKDINEWKSLDEELLAQTFSSMFDDFQILSYSEKDNLKIVRCKIQTNGAVFNQTQYLAYLEDKNAIVTVTYTTPEMDFTYAEEFYISKNNFEEFVAADYKRANN